MTHFFNSYTAHIGQQLSFQYILDPAFHTIFFQHGHDLYVVLGIANNMNIHPSLNLYHYKNYIVKLAFYIML